MQAVFLNFAKFCRNGGSDTGAAGAPPACPGLCYAVLGVREKGGPFATVSELSFDFSKKIKKICKKYVRIEIELDAYG
jgi:hypothetical protein